MQSLDEYLDYLMFKKSRAQLYVFENINKEPIDNLLPYSKNILEKLR